MDRVTELPDINNIPEKIYVSIPFIKGLTDKLIEILNSDNIIFAKNNILKIGNIFSKTKDTIEKDKKWNVVYSVPCSDCELTYIGQTSQQLKQRLTQHKSDIKKVNKNCALAIHCRTLNHTMQFNNAKILEQEARTNKRSFLEMIHIQKNNSHTMNAKTDVKNLSSIYSFLISLS